MSLVVSNPAARTQPGSPKQHDPATRQPGNPATRQQPGSTRKWTHILTAWQHPAAPGSTPAAPRHPAAPGNTWQPGNPGLRIALLALNLNGLERHTLDLPGRSGDIGQCKPLLVREGQHVEAAAAAAVAAAVAAAAVAAAAVATVVLAEAVAEAAEAAEAATDVGLRPQVQS